MSVNFETSNFKNSDILPQGHFFEKMLLTVFKKFIETFREGVIFEKFGKNENADFLHNNYAKT